MSSTFNIGNGMIVMKGYIMVGAILAYCICALLIKYTTLYKFSIKKLFYVFSNAIILSCILEVLLAILQFLNILPKQDFNTLGTFNNSAGYAAFICLSLPIIIYRIIFTQSNTLEKTLCTILLLLCMFTILRSGVRTALLSLLVICAFTFPYYKKITSIITFVVIVSFCILMNVKSASAEGRIFILQRSWELVQQQPWFGYGWKGFECNYMNQQAEYFLTHPNDIHRLLADNIHHPLNEFMYLTVNFGITGFITVISVIICIYRYGIKHSTEYTKFGLLLLSIIIVLSMFSYPFYYPFTWIILGLSLITIFYEKVKKNHFNKSILILIPIILYVYCSSITQAMTWREANKYSEEFKYGKAISLYKGLYTSLECNGSFLYDYSYCLAKAGKYKAALEITNKASLHLSDYNLCLLKGFLYTCIGNINLAISEYKEAHYMCPSRITPLYEVSELIRKKGDKEALLRLQRYVNKMQCKIINENYDKMKHEILMK